MISTIRTDTAPFNELFVRGYAADSSIPVLPVDLHFFEVTWSFGDWFRKIIAVVFVIIAIILIVIGLILLCIPGAQPIAMPFLWAGAKLTWWAAFIFAAVAMSIATWADEEVVHDYVEAFKKGVGEVGDAALGALGSLAGSAANAVGNTLLSSPLLLICAGFLVWYFFFREDKTTTKFDKLVDAYTTKAVIDSSYGVPENVDKPHYDKTNDDEFPLVTSDNDMTYLDDPFPVVTSNDDMTYLDVDDTAGAHAYANDEGFAAKAKEDSFDDDPFPVVRDSSDMTYPDLKRTSRDESLVQVPRAVNMRNSASYAIPSQVSELARKSIVPASLKIRDIRSFQIHELWNPQNLDVVTAAGLLSSKTRPSFLDSEPDVSAKIDMREFERHCELFRPPHDRLSFVALDSAKSYLYSLRTATLLELVAMFASQSRSIVAAVNIDLINHVVKGSDYIMLMKVTFDELGYCDVPFLNVSELRKRARSPYLTEDLVFFAYDNAAELFKESGSFKGPLDLPVAILGERVIYSGYNPKVETVVWFLFLSTRNRVYQISY